MAKTCNICGGKTRFLFKSYNKHGRHRLNTDEKFNIRQCLSCGVVYLEGIKIDDNYYKKNYELGYYDQDGKADSLVGRLLRVMRNFSMDSKERIIRHSLGNKRSIRILDIGCGNGEFLSSLKRLKFHKYGLEINEEGQELCRSKGIKVFTEEIAKVNFTNIKFNVVTMWHVLEHINNPDEMFSEIHKVLSKDGKLIIQTPNIDSIGFRRGGIEWYHLDSPRHLFLYNIKSIKTIAAKNGFKLARVVNEFYDYPLDLFWSLTGQNSIRCFALLLKLISKENLTYVLEKK